MSFWKMSKFEKLLEVTVRRCSAKWMFPVNENLQESTYFRVSFLIKLYFERLQLYRKRDTNMDVSRILFLKTISMRLFLKRFRNKAKKNWVKSQAQNWKYLLWQVKLQHLKLLNNYALKLFQNNLIGSTVKLIQS